MFTSENDTKSFFQHELFQIFLLMIKNIAIIKLLLILTDSFTTYFISKQKIKLK